MSTALAAPDASLSRQPRFEMPWQEHQRRLTTFFRFITAIPAALLLALWSVALWVTVPISWFAIVFTRRYPQSLYDFHASFARYATYVYAYVYLATDRWPGFSGADEVDYPVHLRLGPPLPEYNRMKTLFRLIVGIPVYLIAYAMNIVAQVGAFISWFAIVFTGKQPQGIHQMLRLGLSYQQRALPYGLLLTEDWPQFTQEENRAALAGEPEQPSIPPADAGRSGSAPAAPSAGAPPAESAGGEGFAPPSPPGTDSGER